MNFKTALKLVVVVLTVGAITSCNNSRDYKKNSRATGWDLTGKDGGPKYQTDYKGQKTGPGLVFVEGGTFTMGKVADDPMHDWNNTPTQQTVASFYMDETEVTNRMYLQYLDWLKYTFPPADEKYTQVYEGALPDTLVWRSPLGNFKDLTDNYLRHPAYQNYPVVGVNWIQATEFSKWRSDRVNEAELEEEGYFADNAKINHDSETQFSTNTYLDDPSKVYGGNDSLIRGGKNADKNIEVIYGDTVHKYVQRKDGVIMPEYRLPTEAEWEYAAMGLTSKREYNNYRGRKKYPWDGNYTISGKRKTRGDQLANFKQGYGDYSGVPGWSSDGANVTNEIKSYPPNDFGLYDMAGNVAEWVADVYRPRVDMKLNDMNYFRGNVYTQNQINEDGTNKILESDEIQFDTLRTGRVVATALPGEIGQESIDEDETYLRTNYDRSDNRNYKDGDKESSRFYMQEEELDEESQRMYNSPMDKVAAVKDSLGNETFEKQYDQSNSRTTLIDDISRVVKGGSWKDNAYWLDPGTRRFYPQDMATNWIGFRNAMSRVGQNPEKGKKAR